MTIKDAIYARLASWSGLTALVGTRIYPTQADQRAPRPYVTFFEIKADGPVHVMAALPTLDSTLIQFDAWGETQEATMEISEQIVAAMRGFTGHMGATDGPYVSSCLDKASWDLFEGDSKTYHRAVEFNIYHDAV
jgi:hypothetical protein